MMADTKIMKAEYDKGGKFKDFVDAFSKCMNKSVESTLKDKMTEEVYEDYIKRRIGVYES